MHIKCECDVPRISVDSMPIGSMLRPSIPPSWPFSAKAQYQSFRLWEAVRRTGFSGLFPTTFPELDKPIYVFGSGGSLADFEMDSLGHDSVVKIALNDAMFFSDSFNFISYELHSKIQERPVQNRRIEEIMRTGHAHFLCRLPLRLTSLNDYPSVFLSEKSRVHLFTSFSSRGESAFYSEFNWLNEKQRQIRVGLDPGFSLGRILVRLALMGHKDIRVVGVDLFTVEHFWDHLDSFEAIKKERKLGVSGLSEHNTNSVDRVWSAAKFLEVFAQLCESHGISLTADPRSGVSKILMSWSGS